MTCALLDGDLIAYRSSASCMPTKSRLVSDPLDIAIRRADDMIKMILERVGATSYNLYISGGTNFRTEYNADYKANRQDTVRPEWLEAVREHLVMIHAAKVQDNQEADDAMGICQCSNEDTIICSLDKDMLCIPGRHYSWEIQGTSSLGKTWKKEEVFTEQTVIEAMRHFYMQLLLGDRADNIFGFDGLMRSALPVKYQHISDELASYDDERDMFDFVRGLYDDDERLLKNGRCLWIRRAEGELWNFPK